MIQDVAADRMRIVVRPQITRHPFNACGCAVSHHLGFLSEFVEEEVRRGRIEGRENDAWDTVRILAEQIPDRLRRIDEACGIETAPLAAGIERAIRNRDFNALTNSIASVSLRICGEELPAGGVLISEEQLRRAAGLTEAEERMRQAMR
jgi:hypothetical protein